MSESESSLPFGTRELYQLKDKFLSGGDETATAEAFAELVKQSNSVSPEGRCYFLGWATCRGLDKNLPISSVSLKEAKPFVDEDTLTDEEKTFLSEVTAHMQNVDPDVLLSSWAPYEVDVRNALTSAGFALPSGITSTREDRLCNQLTLGALRLVVERSEAEAAGNAKRLAEEERKAEEQAVRRLHEQSEAKEEAARLLLQQKKAEEKKAAEAAERRLHELEGGWKFVDISDAGSDDDERVKTLD